MNKLIYLGSLLLSVGAFTSVQATDVPGVGVDWASSLMQVEFEPANVLVPASTCFATTTPDTSCVFVAPYTYCVAEDLDTLGYSDTNESPIVEDCFHEAGNYRVTIKLEDFAGNTSEANSVFTVFPGEPDPDQSSLQLSGCALDSTAPVANGDNVCTLTLKVLDAYGNPVTQLSGETAEIYTDSLFPMDANNPNGDAISFLEGLSVDGVELGDSAAKTDYSLQQDLVVGGLGIFKQFALTAVAPTMQKVGTVLASNQAFQLDLSFEFPGVTAEGALDAANPVTFRYGAYSPDVRFRPMVANEIGLVGSKEFIIEIPVQMDFTSNRAALDVGRGSNPEIGITHHNLPWTLEFDPSFFVNEEGTSNPPDESPIGFVGDVMTETKTRWPIVVAREDQVEYTDELSFSSVVEYDMGTKHIAYPGAAMGSGFGDDCDASTSCDSSGIEVKLVGASIEGTILGASETTKLGTGTDESFLVGSNKFTDIREDIFKNAYDITRSLEAKDGGTAALPFDPGWYNATANVILVEGDVKVASDKELPVGKNTLVIKNGNLILEGNLTYANKEDSFGFILLNDTVEPFPKKGNLFIRQEVQRIAGTFFLEGGIMTNDISSAPTIYDSTNASAANDLQLLWEGAILAHSTLGGGYKSLYVLEDPDYVTPWGVVSTLLADANPGYADWVAAGKTALEVAQAYDLHRVRSYKPEYDVDLTPTNGDKCVCTDGSCTAADPSGCDVNDNAFVIRIDGRMRQFPPPGFETIANLKW